MQAKELMFSCNNASQAATAAEALTKNIDQDWQHEATIYTFDDDSVLVVSGPHVNAYATRAEADAAVES